MQKKKQKKILKHIFVETWLSHDLGSLSAMSVPPSYYLREMASLPIFWKVWWCALSSTLYVDRFPLSLTVSDIHVTPLKGA